MKVKYINVSSQVLAEVLKMAAEHALPKDAKILRVDYNSLYDGFHLIVESEEFDDIPEGLKIPLALHTTLLVK